jgi:hypothetical protein
VNATGTPIFRIGTTDATSVNLEDASGAGLSGWGWQDNGYPSILGPLLRFATSGPQTIRIQTREDGFSIDQIVLSSERYLTIAPGSLKLDGTILSQTAPAPPPAGSASEILLRAASAVTIAGGWKLLADGTAAGGTAVGHPDAGAKANKPLAAPVNYVEFRFDAEAGRPYRLWLRCRADRDSSRNDSVFVQFSDSVDGVGNPVMRMGTNDATTVNLEDAAGAGLSGWGWQDNGYPSMLGPLIQFATTGTHTIRIQTREDGLRIDQIVLSPQKYLTSAPGALMNDTTILP